MTTAHRPTWKPAVGGSEQGGNKITVPTRQYSSKDIPGYTSLKSRVFAKQEKDN
jgi:protein CWC15